MEELKLIEIIKYYINRSQFIENYGEMSDKRILLLDIERIMNSSFPDYEFTIVNETFTIVNETFHS